VTVASSCLCERVCGVLTLSFGVREGLSWVERKRALVAS
jgi:hypothetical protein